ncbi:hypothetical protein SADUNF_Sadunf16G0024500 [Salix dunnii]|uniref:Ribosomal protein L41 n=1 Tax=Salix dunnii TaxID=1413687 RepID=A0A835MP48_9ROSI|nr:hypothetical protein SADUNF_Sadunf16G0024500 [Salix dunnii]
MRKKGRWPPSKMKKFSADPFASHKMKMKMKLARKIRLRRKRLVRERRMRKKGSWQERSALNRR